MSKADLIIATGRALWGEPGWQAQMGRAVKVSKDTVQDWRQGRYSPRTGVLVDLLSIAHERRAELNRVIDMLEQEVPRNDDL